MKAINRREYFIYKAKGWEVKRTKKRFWLMGVDERGRRCWLGY